MNVVTQAGRRPHVAKVAAVDPVEADVDQLAADSGSPEEDEDRQSLERLYEMSAEASEGEGEEASHAASFESLIGEVDELGREADDMMSQALQIPQLMHEVQELTHAFDSVSSTERASRQKATQERGKARTKRKCAPHLL